jgi:rare lipoprotein A
MRLWMIALLLTTMPLADGCAASRPERDGPDAFVQEGYASYYSRRSQSRRTASGEIFDNQRLTAAHRTLPFGTRVRVTHIATGRSVVVTITDRGPFLRDRVIDVTRRAARRLGMLRSGTARVRLEVISD